MSQGFPICKTFHTWKWIEIPTNFQQIWNRLKLELNFFLQGATSGQDEKGVASLKTVELDNKMNGRAVQIRVIQGKEPRHFMTMFNGRMIIYSGGHASAFEIKQGEIDETLANSYMLEVRGNEAHNTRAIQVLMNSVTKNMN